MKTKLAALCGTLMVVGCDAGMTGLLDPARPEAGELEAVLIDCTDLDDAEVIPRPEFDGPGSNQITEDGIARPDKDGPDSAAPQPTSGEPVAVIVRPEFDGTDTFAVTESGNESWSDYRPKLDGPNPVDTVSSDGREFPRDPDQVSGEEPAGRFFPQDPRISGKDEAELPANPCDCPDTLCRKQWIEANLGCDVCATFARSEDQQVGACYHCQ